MEYLEWAVDLSPVIIAVASAIVAVTPTPVDNQALKWLRKVLDVLAINVGHAKSAESVIEKQNRKG